MKKRMWKFIIILMSFMAFAPAYAFPVLPNFPTLSDREGFRTAFNKTIEVARKRLITSPVYLESPGVVNIKGKTAVVGDLHGDLFTFRAIRDHLTEGLDEGRIQNVVFLGDIMDRGENSALTLLELLEFFNEFPGKVYIIRGNHETCEMFERFSGDNPAKKDPYFRNTFSISVLKLVLKNFFDSLPYAAVINGHTLAVHGGVPRREVWLRFFGKRLPKEGERDYDVVKSVTWSDYSSYGDAVSINKSRTDGDKSLICYSERDVSDFFRMWSLRGTGTYLESITKNLKYLIRAHQPSLGSAFHQSPNQIVTTVFSAIENQNERFMRYGIKVALVTEDDVPPVPYFAVYSHGGESRECIECPYFCSEERSDSDFHYDPRSELECASYDDNDDFRGRTRRELERTGGDGVEIIDPLRRGDSFRDRTRRELERAGGDGVEVIAPSVSGNGSGDRVRRNRWGGVEVLPAGRNSAPSILRSHDADRYSSTRTPTSRGGSSVTLAPVEIGMEPMGSSTSSGTTKTSMGGYSAGYRRTYK